MRKIAVFFILSATMLSCAFLQQRLAVKNCKFKFVDAKPVISYRDIMKRKIRVKLRIDVQNPNPIKVVVDKLDLLLYINNKETVKTKFPSFNVKAGKSKIISTTLVIPISKVGMGMVTVLKKKGKAEYKLVGKVYIKTPIGMVNFPVTLYKKKV